MRGLKHRHVKIDILFVCFSKYKVGFTKLKSRLDNIGTISQNHRDIVKTTPIPEYLSPNIRRPEYYSKFVNIYMLCFAIVGFIVLSYQ